MHISEIGFEDYYFLSELYCRKENINNPDRHDIKELLRRLFLDSIFNKGKVLNIFRSFPDYFVKVLKAFDNIFTTNYDNNLELATHKEVFYLHGAFHVLDEVYDRKSLRNMLPDRPVDQSPVITGYEHLFSTALTEYSGAQKQSKSEMQQLANQALEKFAESYNNRPDLRSQMDKLKNSSDPLVRNLFTGVKLKSESPNLGVSDDYALSSLSKIMGSVTLMGLSPNNDDHIFKAINDNEGIDSIEFYYYDENEPDAVSTLLCNKNVFLYDIKYFWENCGKK